MLHLKIRDDQTPLDIPGEIPIPNAQGLGDFSLRTVHLPELPPNVGK